MLLILLPFVLLQIAAAQEPIHGVNLGGWLLLEPFITPSLWQPFDPSNPQSPVDERTFCEYLGGTEAKKRLQAHWSSFITKTDFMLIKNYGLTHVRIPIGYWAFFQLPDDPYVFGADEYLEKAIGWARDAGLKVWIDLHGAPGGQNGFDNSGFRDSLRWQEGCNEQYTSLALQMIVSKYGGENYSDVVSAIELLNEPMGPKLDMEKIKKFYSDGYELVRESSSATVVIHDAFQPFGSWNNFLSPKNGHNIILDTHQYSVFEDGQLWLDIDERVKMTCGIGKMLRWSDKRTVVGEFSAAMNDCAQWLNGFNRSSRWEGKYADAHYHGKCGKSNDETSWTKDPEQINNHRRYIEAQMDAYKDFFFWTYKTETADEWSFQKLVAIGAMPIPLHERKYPNQCDIE